MAFNFPDAPAVGDEFVAGGATYIWTGNTWDLRTASVTGDYVERAGDTMTGNLTLVNPAQVINQGTDPTMGDVRLKGGGATQLGMVEWFMGTSRKAFLGWGSATEPCFSFENGCTGVRLAGGGIHIHSDSAVGDRNDMSKGVCLYGYGGTSKFGFSITSGTLNYVVQNGGNFHKFWCGDDNILTLSKDTVTVDNSNLHNKGGLTCDGLMTVNDSVNVNGNINLRDGDVMTFSNGCQIRKIYGANDFQFHTNANQTFNFHISGTGDVYVIDTVGSTGNAYIPGRGNMAVREEVEAYVAEIETRLMSRISELEAEIVSLKKERQT